MATGKTIAKFLISIGVDVQGAKKAKDDVDGSTKSAEDTDKKGSPKLKAFAAAAKIAFGGVAVAAAASSAAILAAGTAIFSFANEQTHAMAEVSEGAKKLGLGADEYQRLIQVAEKTGTSMDHLGGGVRRLNAEMLNVASGNGAAFEEKLAAIGLTASQLEGKSTTDQIGMIGDALNMVEDASTRAARAATLFGEDAGPGMANVLTAGSVALTDLAAAAEGIFTDEQLAKADEFQDALTEAKHVFAGVAGELAVALAPAILQVTDAITTFIHDNDKLIKQDLPKILETVLEHGLKLIPIVMDVASGVADLVIQAEPLIDVFLDFTSGSLQAGMEGVLGVLNAVLPVVLGVAGAVTEIVTGVDILQTKSAKRGAPKFLSEIEEEKERGRRNKAKVGLGDKAKAAAGMKWAIERDLSAEQLARQAGQIIDAGQAKTIEQAFQQLRNENEQLLIMDEEPKPGEKPKPKGGRGGGAKKAKTAEKKSAFFGDYRDVLATYAGRTPEDSLKALEQLEKGVMPADHKPETSITITNHNQYDIDVGGITVVDAQNPKATGQGIMAELQAIMKKTAATMPNNVLR
jgi:hypothetical protein